MKIETALINDWIAKNGGARRFEQGFNSSFDTMQHYLASKGITPVRYRRHYRISKPKGRPKLTNWDGVADLVDEVRLADGLQPLRIKHAA